MKAVVMAGGEGTRLRPLTSNQPKPMVPIVGKPCMEHILELLRKHGLEDVIVTVAFMPQAIRSYFGDGESARPEHRVLGRGVAARHGGLGAARQRPARRDLPRHLRRRALRRRPDRADRHAQARRAPRSRSGSSRSRTRSSSGSSSPTRRAGSSASSRSPRGARSSRTRSTPASTCSSPRCCATCPTDRPYDFSKELFPLLLEMGRPLYGHVLDGYWQDIGNLDQFRQANFDALDERVQLDIRGIRLRGNIWLGEGVEVDDLDAIEGPAYLGNYCRIAPDASVGAYSVLGSSVTLRERARTERSVIDAATHIGRSARVEGAIVGRACDIRAHAHVHEGAAIGDEVDARRAERRAAAGADLPVQGGRDRRADPREPDLGVARLVEPVRQGRRLRARQRRPDAGDRGATRRGARDGAQARRARRREPRVAGSVPDDQAGDDLRPQLDRRRRRRPARAPGLGQPPPAEDARATTPASTSASATATRRCSRSASTSSPGSSSPPALQKEIEKHFTRHELRRAAFNDGRRGHLSGPRARELRAGPARRPRRGGDPRARLPDRRRLRLLGHLVRAAAAARPARRRGGLARTASPRTAREPPTGLREAVGQAKRLVTAIGADLGVVFDRAGERLFLIDEQAREIPVEQALLLFLRLIGSNGRHGQARLPDHGHEPRRRAGRGQRPRGHPHARLARRADARPRPATASSSRARSAAATSSRSSCRPTTRSRASASCSSCSRRSSGRSRSSSPSCRRSTLVHRQLPCPWALKGTVMRVLTERLRDRDVDLLDGIKVFDERGWAQVLPDPDEPLVHIYAEGRDRGGLGRAGDRAARARRGDHGVGGRNRRRRSLKLRLTLRAPSA